MHLTLSSTSRDTIDDAMRSYVTEKITALGKYCDLESPDTHIAVQLGKGHGKSKNDDDLYYAEIHLKAPGVDQYVNAYRSDQQTAFDEARAEMARVLGKAKDKQVSLMRRGRNAVRKLLRFGK